MSRHTFWQVALQNKGGQIMKIYSSIYMEKKWAQEIANDMNVPELAQYMEDGHKAVILEIKTEEGKIIERRIAD